tara:strand:+ start:66 stop:347 length:282 start_codon:yes stop_codon:yes gene_type:complete
MEKENNKRLSQIICSSSDKYDNYSNNQISESDNMTEDELMAILIVRMVKNTSAIADHTERILNNVLFFFYITIIPLFIGIAGLLISLLMSTTQ